VRSAAHWSSLSDDEANIFRAVRMHYIVKRDRFSFAISDAPKFNFCRRFPLGRETVGDFTQILNPMIDQDEGEVLLDGGVCGKESRTNPGHLLVIRSGADTQIDGLSETREGKETNQSNNQNQSLSASVGSDTYENHDNYGLYSTRYASFLASCLAIPRMFSL
jgi:hypothetical protein